MSLALLALLVWDRWPREPLEPLPGWGPKAKVYAPEEAPGLRPPTPKPEESARAAGGPLDGAAPPPPAMSEEQRSARNEELIAGLERQKKRMGIARVIPRWPEGTVRELGYQPLGLVAASPRELRNAWARAGLADPPPHVDFRSGRVAVLMIPGRILGVRLEPARVLVLYQADKKAPAARRWTVIPARPSPVEFEDEFGAAPAKAPASP